MVLNEAHDADPVSMTEAIAHFAVETPSESIPGSARHILRLSLLDWLAVAIAGKDEPVSTIVRKLVADEAGAPDATVIGHDVKLPARAAALANGACAHALDYDDTHFVHLGHPSAVVMSATLAMAEKLGALGQDVLDAALIGVETGCRIGAWLGREHYRHGFHQTATTGSFGAAMAAARLLGLDEERARHALGIASTRTSGLKSQFGTMGKPYHAGMAAANGVEAALLAAAGFVSRPDGLECAQGFCETHAGAGNDPAAILDGLGRDYVFEAVQHKFHACCHGTHAALEALIEARDAHGVTPDDVRSVTVTVNPGYLTVCNIAEPATGLEAKFSYRLTAAMALSALDTGSLSTFSSEACADPDLVSLRDRVLVATDADLADTAARVAIDRVSGDPFELHHDIAAPLKPSVRETRVRSKAASLLSEDRAASCWKAIAALARSTAPFELKNIMP